MKMNMVFGDPSFTESLRLKVSKTLMKPLEDKHINFQKNYLIKYQSSN